MISPTGRPWLDELASAAEQFTAALAAAEQAPADLSSPVPACPGWTLQDLGVHLGRVHRWTAGILQGADPRQRPNIKPAAGQLLSEWYCAESEALRRALAATGPDAPCWTMADEQRTAVFWQRRQVHETVVHLWDAHRALDQRIDLDPVLAFDGVAEVRDVMYPRMRKAERVKPLTHALVFCAEDVASPPVVIGHAQTSLEVRAPAVTLMLLVWQRIPWRPSYGDAAAEGLVTQSLVP